MVKFKTSTGTVSVDNWGYELQGTNGNFDTRPAASNIDTISDFDLVDDRIVLDHDIFTKLKAGSLSGAAFVIGTRAADSSDRIIHDSRNGDLFYDADGSGKAAAVQCAELDSRFRLMAGDFLIV